MNLLHLVTVLCSKSVKLRDEQDMTVITFTAFRLPEELLFCQQNYILLAIEHFSQNIKDSRDILVIRSKHLIYKSIFLQLQ